jgi:hypothetical protein
MNPAAMSGLSWAWIAGALALPALLAVLVALPFWLKGNPIIGNAIATALLFTTTVAAIGREYFELQRLTRQCMAAGVACPIDPDPFTRFAIYGGIGIVQIAGLFVVSLRLEERARRQALSPEWR